MFRHQLQPAARENGGNERKDMDLKVESAKWQLRKVANGR